MIRDKIKSLTKTFVIRIILVVIALILAAILILSVVLKKPVTDVVVDIKREIIEVAEHVEEGRQPVADEDNPIPRPELDVQLLTPNKYSRPGYKINKIKDIVIHYTANPGTSAQNNRDYFEGLKDNHYTMASSHFIIGIDGEIIQCIPTSEFSYASNERNKDTISIENCYINEDGSFEKATYKSLVHLTAWLIVKFGLEPDNIIRHYDVTGKICPKYYVENEKEWKKFKKDVKKYINKYIENY